MKAASQHDARQKILKHLQTKLETNEQVYAMWLEGSDGTGTSDEFSDLDINVDVEDSYELEALSFIRKSLEELGTLDSISVVTQPNEHLWFQVFHMHGTSPHLLIDVNIQRHSRNFSFCRQNTAETPLVLFDKANVITFHDVNAHDLEKRMQSEIKICNSRIDQYSRVEKYIKRGNFLEAFAYYQRYVLEPIVHMARIIHSPLNTDYNLVRISQQLPSNVLHKIEYLYQISSLQDIEDKLPLALRLFQEIQASYQKAT